MYIFELIFNIKEKLKQRAEKRPSGAAEDFEEETCEHVFQAVDSTNTVLACVKCGFLIHCGEDDFKKKNIFAQEATEPTSPL